MRQKLGNISQLQDLLFGEQIEVYDRQFREQAQTISDLESKQQEFQLLIEEQIEQLENRLTLKIDSLADTLEKKLKYLNVTTQDSQKKLQQDFNFISQFSQEKIDLLQNNLKLQTDSLRTEITQSKANLNQDFEELKQQIMERLQSSLNQLSTGKVSRDDLAEVLFELCLKLKEPNTELTSFQELNNSKVVDLVVQEQQSSIEH